MEAYNVNFQNGTILTAEQLNAINGNVNELISVVNNNITNINTVNSSINDIKTIMVRNNYVKTINQESIIGEGNITILGLTALEKEDLASLIADKYPIIASISSHNGGTREQELK